MSAVSPAYAPPEAMTAGPDPRLRAAAYLSLSHAALWGFLLFRWVSFGRFAWDPLPAELALATWPPLAAYLIYGGCLVLDLVVAVALWVGRDGGRRLGLARAGLAVGLGLVYYALTREFFGAATIVGLAGALLVLELKASGWSLAYPSAYFLLLFFVVPMVIVLVVSLGERSRLGTVIYPALDLDQLGVYFNDYLRFFSRINGELIYLRIFWRSVFMASLNTAICLLFGYPFAYWIARQPNRYRGLLIFLVMIPFWTNFLVRTYAWMLILRDSGIINGFWTITLHDLAVPLAGRSDFFAWMARITERRLPLLFNQPAVFMGLFYGYVPFMILPLYSTLEKLDWSLLEAAADLGAGALQRTTRILLPLTMPGIVAGSIIVFIPTLGAYVTPDLLGGGKVTMLGNLLQQQFMTVRDWPFGAAIGFLMMALMLLAILIYFRVLGRAERL